MSDKQNKLVLSLNLVDEYSEMDFCSDFSKMLIPNRIFNRLVERSDELDEEHKANFEYLLYIVNTIYRRYQIAFNLAQRHHWPIDLSKWAVPIYSKIYRRILGNEYMEYVHILENWGIIGRAKSYFKGNGKVQGRCKHYWFTPELLSYVHRYLVTRSQEQSGEIEKRKGGVRVVKAANKNLFRRLSKRAEEVHNEQMKVPEVRELYGDLHHYVIDKEKSVEVLGNLVAEGVIKPKRIKEELSKVNRFNSYETDKYALYVKRDAYGRVHTNLTNIKREIRHNCLLCDGKPTVEIDIKSSQGAFLHRVLEQYLANVDEREEIDENAFAAELDEYRKLVSSGGLYECFQGYVNRAMGSEFDRNTVKKDWLCCLFCRNPKYSEKKHPLVVGIENCWKERFPHLYGAVRAIKRGHYAELAHELQRTESNFVFKVVYRRIKDELHCPVCTIHDSIVVPEECGDRAKEIFDDALKEMKIPSYTEMERMEAFIADTFVAER